MLKRVFQAAFLAGFTCLCAGSAGVTAEPFTLTSVEEENKMGEDAYKEILTKEKVCTDRIIVALVERVTARVTAAAPDKGFQYAVSVLDSPTANAFCLPGGKICVYTGILPYCQNEASLAVVVGHEVAHAVLRHSGQRMTQAAMVDLLGGGLSQFLQYAKVSGTTEKVALAAYGYGTQLGVILPYSRANEVEADEAGVMYMAKAGYDPREAPQFWKRFAAVGGSTPAFLSTHPAYEDREQRLEKLLPTALKLYVSSPQQRSLGVRFPEEYLTPPKATEVAQGQASTQAGTVQPTKTQPVAVPPGKTTAGRTPSVVGLAEQEIRRGLQEALASGFKSALTQLGKEDGFFRDELVKIVMPEQISGVEKALRLVGKGKTVDEFVLQMNRAAEKAMPVTADLLAQAVAGLTIEDAQSILHGAPDAATQYFNKTCRGGLEEKIKPIVQKATEAAGATGTYKSMLKKAGFAASLLVGDFDLDTYVTGKAVDGLMVKMADEEKRIRANPAGQTSDILRKVFGVLKK